MEMMMTRVFVKKGGPRRQPNGAIKDTWPKRMQGPKDAKVLIELPTEHPIGADGKKLSTAGQFCVVDDDVMKFIDHNQGSELWKQLGNGAVSGKFVEGVWNGTSAHYYQNILKSDVINLVFR